MATDTLSKTQNESHAYNTGLVEDASADLFVADVFCSVTETSLNALRACLQELNVGQTVLHEMVELDAMLFEIKDKIRVAKEKVDRSVDECFAARRAAKSGEGQ